jgi:hypothetical protein
MPNKNGSLLSTQAYDFLKPIATTYLPAAGTLYFTVAQIWGLPAATEVVGTIVAINTFLGVVLGISTRSYNQSEAKYDGAIHVVETNGQRKYSLDLKNEDPESILEQSEALFKVENNTTTSNTATLRKRRR